MKEFVEKLIGRLEYKLGDVNFEKDTQEVNESYFEGLAYAYGDVINIVNQLAEEYNKRDFYEITLNGCDDNTVFVMAMTKQEHEFLLRLSEKANETSTYCCMPRLYVEKAEMIELKAE